MGGIVESSLHRHLRGPVRRDDGQDMNCFERDRGNINQVYVPVDAPVQTKVAEIRRNSIGIGGVVAEDRDRNATLCVCQRQSLQGFGDVEVKLVITALMRSDQQGPDPKRGRLARTLEVQDRSPLDKGITQRKPRTVPSLAAKIRLVRDRRRHPR